MIDQNKWIASNILITIAISLSLIFQVIIAIILVYLAKQNEFLDERKRRGLLKCNSIVTILILIITSINVFINVFLIAS